MRFDFYRMMGVIYPVIVVGLMILFLVSFYLFINRLITSRRNTVSSLQNIEHKLDLILSQLSKEEGAVEFKTSNRKGVGE